VGKKIQRKHPYRGRKPRGEQTPPRGKKRFLGRLVGEKTWKKKREKSESQPWEFHSGALQEKDWGGTRGNFRRKFLGKNYRSDEGGE